MLCMSIGQKEDIDIFLKLEKLLFEKRMKNILLDSALEIEGHINRGAFDASLTLWDGNIDSMDNQIPVKTVSFANTPVPLTFHISFLPPEINITNQNFSFKGLQNQSVTYKIIFPHGIDSIEFSDDLDRAIKGETDDGRAYLEISFDESEAGMTDEVTCKMHPSTLFVLGIFTPCIISFIITMILLVIIYFLRKKRRRSRGIPVSSEEISGYEDQDYYVPPPPNK